MRAHSWGCGKARLARTLAGIVFAAIVLAAPASAATYSSGGVGMPPPLPPPNSGGTPIDAVLLRYGAQAFLLTTDEPQEGGACSVAVWVLCPPDAESLA